MYVNGIETFILLVHVDVGNFLRFKSCVLYSELEYPAEPLINVEVVAHVTRPEFRCSEVSFFFFFFFGGGLLHGHENKTFSISGVPIASEPQI